MAEVSFSQNDELMSYEHIEEHLEDFSDNDIERIQKSENINRC